MCILICRFVSKFINFGLCRADISSVFSTTCGHCSQSRNSTHFLYFLPTFSYVHLYQYFQNSCSEYNFILYFYEFTHFYVNLNNLCVCEVLKKTIFKSHYPTNTQHSKQHNIMSLPSLLPPGSLIILAHWIKMIPNTFMVCGIVCR